MNGFAINVKYVFYIAMFSIFFLLVWMYEERRNERVLDISTEFSSFVYVKINNKGAYIDPRRQSVAIPPIYDFIIPDEFSDLLYVGKDGSKGFIDMSGNIVIPLEYGDILGSPNGILKASKNGKFGFINYKGETVVPFDEFDGVGTFDMGDQEGGYVVSDFAPVYKNGKSGFVNTKGEMVIPLIYEDVSFFYYYDLAGIKINNKWGFINKDGDIVISPQFDSYSFFDKNGLARVSKNRKYGIINIKGDVVIPLIYDNALTYVHNDLIALKLNDKWGLANRDSDIIMPFIFEEKIIGIREKESPTFMLNGEVVTFNKGDLLKVTESPEHVWKFDSYGLAKAHDNGRWGYINSKLNYVISPQYDKVENFNAGGFAKVVKAGKWIIIDKKGRRVLYLDSVCDVDIIRSNDNSIVYPENRTVSDICAEAQYQKRK